jgi:2-hydroxy-6-oxonona-2,4-dienedioate hydrolase
MAAVGIDEAKYRAAERRYWNVEGVNPAQVWLELPSAGTRVRVQVIGDGPPVLLVHGVSNSGTSWAPLASRLHGFRRLLLDRPGCGLSEASRTRVDDVHTFASVGETLIVDVLDALGLERADIVATCLGGYYALRTASVHPDRVRRVVELGMGAVDARLRSGSVARSRPGAFRRRGSTGSAPCSATRTRCETKWMRARRSSIRSVG